MKIKITGLADFNNMADDLLEKVTDAVDGAIEKRALKMVNDTKASAPVLTGKLRGSIDIIPQDTAKMTRTYGTNVAYARRQEYENKTHKGYFRNNINKHKPLLLNDIKNAVQDTTS